MTDRDRLIELLKPHVSGTACLCESGSCELTSCRDCKAKRLADYLLANGVIVPPCKVGDTVYIVFSTQNFIGECEVTGFVIQRKDDVIKFKNGTIYTVWDKDYSIFGKYIFLTKEEAEAELRKRSGNND